MVCKLPLIWRELMIKIILIQQYLWLRSFNLPRPCKQIIALPIWSFLFENGINNIFETFSFLLQTSSVILKYFIIFISIKFLKVSSIWFRPNLIFHTYIHYFSGLKLNSLFLNIKITIIIQKLLSNIVFPPTINLITFGLIKHTEMSPYFAKSVHTSHCMAHSENGPLVAKPT